MVDLHTHLLPGIDDGPPDVEGSVALARAAAEQGTRILGATPHLRGDFPDSRAGELAGRCREVRAALVDAGIDILVVQGAEAGLTWAVHAGDDELAAASYAGLGTDLLVETPYTGLSDTFEELLFAVARRGYRLVLAHPENNPSFQRSPRRLYALAERGVLLQVTARSLLRGDRRGSRALAAALVRDGVAHVLASDAHSAGPKRPPELAAGAAAAAELVGAPRARWMVDGAPAAILVGQPLPEPPPIAARRRSLWDRLLGT